MLTISIISTIGLMNNSQHDSEEGNDNDNHTVGTSSTSNNNSSSLNKSNQVVVNEKTKNSYISMLSSCDDQPRDNVKGPQLKIRVKVIEENI